MCFGFPAPRALKLGVRLGYYMPAGKIFVAAKPVLKKVRLPLGVYKKCLPAKSIECFAWLNALPVHSPPTEALFSLKKGASYWQWRFAGQVGKPYLVIRVWRWGQLCAAAVVLPSPDTLEIIDFALSDWQHLGLLQNAVEKTALANGLKQISIWGTRQVVEAFSFPNPDTWINADYLALPGEKLDARLSAAVENNCWFVGGDTDFR